MNRTEHQILSNEHEEQSVLPSSKKPRLGRGLGALVPVSEKNKSITEVPVQEIETNPHQPRQFFSQSQLQELADSIKEYGIIQPLLVKKEGRRYVLIAGERRLQAAKLAGLNTVPVMLREATEKEFLELAIIENIQRTDLNPLEEAIAYQQLIDEFGLTQVQIAKKLSKSHSAVSNTLRLLLLPQEVKKALFEGTISEGHARALLGAESAKDLLALFHKVVKKNLSVRETERLVREHNSAVSSLQVGFNETEGQEKSIFRLPEHIKSYEKKLHQHTGLPVSISVSKRGGRLTISFKTVEELQELLEKKLGFGDRN